MIRTERWRRVASTVRPMDVADRVVARPAGRPVGDVRRGSARSFVASASGSIARSTSALIVLLVGTGTNAALAAGAVGSGHCAVDPERDVRAAGEVRIEGGAFTMGSDRGYADEGPAHRASTGGFWIDRHEVTNARFAEFVEATGYETSAEREQRVTTPDGEVIVLEPGSAVFRSPERLVTGHFTDWWSFVPGASWRHPEGPGSDLEERWDHPVVHVSQADARAYAEWAGRALPSERQWEYAAKYVAAGARSGKGARIAPEEPGAVTASGGEASSTAPEKVAANTWEGLFPLRNTERDGFSGTAPVGCYAANAAGLHDMIGNVWEWTADRYRPSHRQEVAPRESLQPEGEETFVVKGGSHLCSPDYCFRSRAAARLEIGRLESSSHVGFRTVRLAR